MTTIGGRSRAGALPALADEQDDVNVALAEGEDGQVVVHRADCPDVRAQAERGEMVATLLDIQNPLPDDLERHSCLTEEEPH